MKKRQLVIVGYGEHGRIVEQIACSNNLFEWIGYVDDVQHKECLGKVTELPTLQERYKNLAVFVAIGQNSARERIHHIVRKANIPFASVVHPTAVIESNVRLGKGVFVGAGTIVNNASIIGDGVYINTGCIVEHDNEIGNFTHLAPGVITGGGVKIGPKSFVGLGSVINDHLSLGDDVFVGSGSVVNKSLVSNIAVIGSPAVEKNLDRKIRSRFQ